MFFADNHGMVDWDDSKIVKAAADSIIPHGEGPAAGALQEIYMAVPDIYKMPMDCPKRAQ